ncbi:dihydrofolate reductase [Patescibacteria group bacterium]|nr:dihydrofolate reductase [Patescibacteria group bacterium]MBU2220754.1 dihydrofolate reductase [Patescibacteria group bacterium]
MAQETKERISIVVSLGRDGANNRAIGKDNTLLWHIPDDLKRFKELTLGHSVIMGRKTWESLPEKYRPLPGRTNIVVTRNQSYEAPGAHVVHSFGDALRLARTSPGSEEIHIGGGIELYKEALPLVSRLYLTLIDDEKESDTFFPEYESVFTKKLSEEVRDWDGIAYRWVTLERE